MLPKPEPHPGSLRSNPAGLGILMLGLTAFSCSTRADHGALGFGIGTAGPIITNTGITMPEGKFFVGSRAQYISLHGLSAGPLLAISQGFEQQGQARHLHSLENYIDVGLTAGWGITDDLTVGLVMPYVWRNDVGALPHLHQHGPSPTSGTDDHHHDAGEDPNHVHHHSDDHDHGDPVDSGAAVPPGQSPSVVNTGSPNGIGDLTLFGQYRFFKSDDNATHVSALFSMRAPTGRTDRVTRRLPPDGQRALFDTHLQPGNGSWSGGIGLAATQGFGRFAVDASVFYNWATKGAQDTDLGDTFDYNLALSYALSPVSDNPLEAATNLSPWTLILELNGMWNDYNRINGVKDPDTGGNLLFLSPGFRYSGGENWNVGFSFGIPIVTDTNGFQSDPDFRVFNRLSIVF